MAEFQSTVTLAFGIFWLCSMRSKPQDFAWFTLIYSLSPLQNHIKIIVECKFCSVRFVLRPLYSHGILAPGTESAAPQTLREPSPKKSSLCKQVHPQGESIRHGSTQRSGVQTQIFCATPNVRIKTNEEHPSEST